MRNIEVWESCNSYTTGTGARAIRCLRASFPGATWQLVSERRAGKPARKRSVVSAGGIVIRGASTSRQVLLVRMARGSWSFPKGRVERGESREEAAEREVHEEAGVDAKITGFAGDVRYFYRDEGALVSKVVHLYLMRWEAGEPMPDRMETVEAIFVAESEVVSLLSYDSERAVWQLARELLGAEQATGNLQ